MIEAIIVCLIIIMFGYCTGLLVIIIGFALLIKTILYGITK